MTDRQASEDLSWIKNGNLCAEEVRRQYDQWAASYDETLAEWGYTAPDDVAKRLRSVLPADAAIFDAGCGTGLSGRAIRKAGFTGRLDGGDLSPDSVRLAARREAYDHLRELNFEALPLPAKDDAYDAVICVGVLTYIDDLEALMHEFRRIVRPGGYILFTHREDLFEEESFRRLRERFVKERLWEEIEVTEPLPYMPKNPEYGEEVGVVHGLCRVKA